MPNVLTLTVEDPDEILNSGAYGANADIRVQAGPDSSGPFADLTGTGSTPLVPVVTQTFTYTAYDPNGTSSDWYRTRFENVGATRLSDWSDPFQVGDETGGYLCSLFDVLQELGETGTNTARDEALLEKIRQVSAAIEGYCGRWFAPRPSNPASTTTYRFNTEAGYSLSIRRGIRTITSLNVAAWDQPDTGGTYTAALSTDYSIQPPLMDRDIGWPGTRVVFLGQASGTTNYFVDALNGAEITGSFGFAAVPWDIQGVAVRAAVRRYIGKGGGGVSVAVGPKGTEILLPDMSGADRLVLDGYKRLVNG